jgi:hypothetical protein
VIDPDFEVERQMFAEARARADRGRMHRQRLIERAGGRPRRQWLTAHGWVLALAIAVGITLALTAVAGCAARGAW